MGIYAPLIRRAQSANRAPEVPLSTRLITVPTVITGTRIPLALKAAERVIRGEKYATPYAAAMAASDMEGLPGRWMDKHFPDLGLGSSEFGTDADVGADAIAAIILAAANLAGPNITKTAKVATALLLGKEGTKAAWYMLANKEFRAALAQAELPDGKLELPVSPRGKEATAEALGALAFATATNDVESPYLRMTLSGLAIGHAGAATKHGFSVLGDYKLEARDQIDQIQAGMYKPTSPATF